MKTGRSGVGLLGFFLNPGDCSYSRCGGARVLGRDSGLEGDAAHGTGVELDDP